MLRHLLGKTLLSPCGMVIVLFLGSTITVSAQTVPVTVVLESDGEDEARRDATIGTPEDVSQSTHFTLFKELVLPRVESKEARDQRLRDLGLVGGRARPEAEESQLRGRQRIVGGTVRYERVDADHDSTLDTDGNIYSTNAQLLWDMDNLSYGFLIPYDFLQLDDFNEQHIGILGFGKYRLPVSTTTTVGFLLDGLYTYTANDKLENINTFGGGAALTLAFDLENFVAGGAVSYQFTADDSDSKNDQRHLLRVGGDLGVRLGDRMAVTVFGIWNHDATDYDNLAHDVDENYFDLGIELAWSLTPAWSLTGGYKRVLGLDDFESNMVFLGTLLRF